MRFFPSLRVLTRMAKSLELIAQALTYFAVEDARRTGRIYFPGHKPSLKDDSSFSVTDDKYISIRAKEKFERFLQQGLKDEDDE